MIKELANSGLHDKVFSIIRNQLPNKKVILDIGAGEGAFTQRLVNSGSRIYAADIEPKKFKVENVDCIKLDLNEKFNEFFNQKFDIIVAIEIIEHIENQWNFIRSIYSLLNDEGIAIITTPNVENIPSRLKFLLNGHIRGFEFSEFNNPMKHESQHINPIFTTLFLPLLKKCGFNKFEHYIYPNKAFTNSTLKTKLISSVINPFLKGIKNGENHIFILYK